MTETLSSSIRILVVDDHIMFREGITRMLEREPDFEVTGQAASAADALSQIAPSGANLVLLDVDLGADRAIDFVSHSRRNGYAGAVLVVTAGVSDREAVQLIQSGVAGIIHKNQSSETLCAAIRQVIGGEPWLEKNYLAGVFRSMDRGRDSRRPNLTARDRAVMRYLLQGLTNREMAGKLEVSEGAVKASLRVVCQKLGVRTRTQLVKVTLEQYKDQL